MLKKSAPLTITLTPHAYWRLQWLCHRTPCEVSTMGLLTPVEGGFLIDEFILVKQSVTTMSVDLDMKWWADKQIEIYEKDGVEPWGSSCWCHTHPEGINQPSPTDEKTMAGSFGSWDFALMLILTKGGVFYARMDFDHEFAGSEKSRFSASCAVEVAWGEAGISPITEKTIEAWEKEFRKLVHERTADWFLGAGDIEGDLLMHRPPNKSKGKEIENYVEDIESFELDPDDPNSIDNYLGIVPEEIL